MSLCGSQSWAVSGRRARGSGDAGGGCMGVLSILNNSLSRIGGVGLEVGSKYGVRWKNDRSMPKIWQGHCDNYIVASLLRQSGDYWGVKATHPKSDSWCLWFARASSLQHKFRAWDGRPSGWRDPRHSLDWRVIFEDTSFLHEEAQDETYCCECLRRQGVFWQNGSAADPQWVGVSPQSLWVRNLDGHAVK